MCYTIFVMDMKEHVKVFFIALAIGMVVAFFLSYKFQDDVAFAINPKVTIFYVGTYNNYDDASIKSRDYQNSVLYQENGTYKVVIGVYQDSNVIDLMSSYYRDQGVSIYQEEIKVDSSFLKEVSEYEILIKSSDSSYFEVVNASLLQLFLEYLEEKV